MEHVTIQEMAEILGITPGAVKMRLATAKIKPLYSRAMYDKSALEAIRNVPGKGRPPKPKPKPE